MSKKKINAPFYTETRLGVISLFNDTRLPNGWLYANGRNRTKIKPEDLPDNYMQGRHNQAIASIFQCMRHWNKTFTEVEKTFHLLLPPEHQITEEDVACYSRNYMADFYAGKITTIRKIMQNMKEEFVEATEILGTDDFFNTLYHAAEDVADDDLDQFVWDYLHREKPPSLLLREESN